MQPGLSTVEQERLRGRIVAEIRRLDLAALLSALDLLGYRGDRVEFRSNPTSAHTSSLFSSIELAAERALVTVNLGLMSNQGPLPSYFTALLEDQRDSAFSELLWFFDNQLLRRRIAALLPERDATVLPRWAETRRQLLLLLRLSAPCGLHWLFQRAFPELEVLVRRRLAARAMQTSGTSLGGSRLGDSSSMGGLSKVPVSTLEVRLCTDEWEAAGRVPWAHAAPRRLRDQVLPLLAEVDTPLVVMLVIRDREGHARLMHGNLLGYDPIARPGSLAARSPIDRAAARAAIDRQAARSPIDREAARAASRGDRRAQRVELWRSSGPAEETAAPDRS